jgi:hypothetical protein
VPVFAALTAIVLFAESSVIAQPAKAPPPSREAELKKAIGAVWEPLAAWCMKWKLREEARAAAEEALAADPASAKAKAALGRTDREQPAANETLWKEDEKKLEPAKKHAAALWKQLAAEPHADKDHEAYGEHRGRTLALDPKSIRGPHEAESAVSPRLSPDLRNGGSADRFQRTYITLPGGRSQFPGTPVSCGVRHDSGGFTFQSTFTTR